MKGLLIAAGLLLIAGPALAKELTLYEIVDLANKALRGDSSHTRLTMTITTPKWKRSLDVEGYNKGRQLAYILMHSPPREKGNATLRRHNEMWLWMKRVERVIKIPPTMMHSSWQGSDFTYEDIVKADSVVKDYEHTIIKKTVEKLDPKTIERLGLTVKTRTVYEIQGIPRPDAPVVWGKILFWAAVYDEKDVVPIKEEDYSERGELIRTIDLTRIKRIAGRLVPMRLECRPTRKPGQKTTLDYKWFKFDFPIKDSFFSISRLQKGR